MSTSLIAELLRKKNMIERPFYFSCCVSEMNRALLVIFEKHKSDNVIFRNDYSFVAFLHPLKI